VTYRDSLRGLHTFVKASVAIRQKSYGFKLLKAARGPPPTRTGMTWSYPPAQRAPTRRSSSLRGMRTARATRIARSSPALTIRRMVFGDTDKALAASATVHAMRWTDEGIEDLDTAQNSTRA